MARSIIAFVDCGGKMCYKGGTMNMNRCRCTCEGLYKGPSCQKCKSVDLFDLTHIMEKKMGQIVGSVLVKFVDFFIKVKISASEISRDFGSTCSITIVSQAFEVAPIPAFTSLTIMIAVQRIRSRFLSIMGDNIDF